MNTFRANDIELNGRLNKQEWEERGSEKIKSEPNVLYYYSVSMHFNAISIENNN